ncbi:MAG: dTDP-4-dehydrorhamnose 3,5-epimerase [Candidatus Binatia bacterium]|nr:MAG: dTDP-4-dehydrorhamnose 3,5-epimerase [Candidatus Binatia bacterium]
MRVLPTALEGVVLIEPDVHRDGRGLFLETYRADRYRELGIADVFVQDNFSRSVARTLRGLHAQRTKPQAKLVRVVRGEIYDVVVDIRRGSPTYRRWAAFRLSESNFLQCYVPVGFAHGFCVLSDVADVEYKCTDFYDPGDELRIRWDDPELGIGWPVDSPILSPKDAAAPPLREVEPWLPSWPGPGAELKPR